MAKVGAGEASTLSPDGVSMPMALTAITICFVSHVSVHGGGLNAEGRPATENALAITAIVAVVLHLAAMLRRPTVLPRRGSHLCACRGVRACASCAEARATGDAR